MSNFETMKQDLWKAAELKVRHDLAQMPDKDRPLLKEIAEKEFPEMIEEIKQCKVKFWESTDLPTAGHFSGRYAVLNRRLFRDVSLFILGVDVKKRNPG